MKEKTGKNIVTTILYIFIVVISILAEAIIFIPVSIWGLSKGLDVKSVIKAFWIDGFYKNAIDVREKFRGL